MDSESLTREQCLYLAKLAEQAERYDEMVGFMERLVRGFGDLTVEERNLCSAAYKNMVGPRRAAWQIVSSVELKEEGCRNEDHAALVRGFRARIEAELSSVCGAILDLIDSYLAPSATSCEAKVFYLKMKGDYHRYLAEFKTGDERREAVVESMEAYKAAQAIALSDIAPTHPIRLGLALNFSVFYYEILGLSEKACSTAKQAFDEALSEVDNIGEECYKDSTLIMQLLRDNLTIWTSEAQVQTDEA